MKKILKSLPLAISYLLFAGPLYAQNKGVSPTSVPGKAAPSFNPASRTTVDIGSRVSDFFGFKCITELVFRMVDIAIILSGILLLVYLVYGGLEWLTSGGDKAKLESARSKITNALIGVAIIAAAFALWKIVLAFFGINAPDICSANPLG